MTDQNLNIKQFKSQMTERGLDPGEIIPDGSIHRFSTDGDRPRETSGAYCHNGAVGWFQDWRTMCRPETAKGKLSKTEQAALHESLSGASDKVPLEVLQANIRRIWDIGTDPEGHPYLKRKGITAPPEVKQHDGCLVIPVFGAAGEFNGLQRIYGDGRKKFFNGTRKKGSFFSISGNGTYIVCEGFATGVSLHLSTGASVVVAFDAGNLLPVARVVSKKISSENIIIAGDDDAWRPLEDKRNGGAEAAREAARKIGARVVLPQFKSPDGKKTTDFNDLHRIEGLDIVKAQLEAAKKQTGSQSDELQDRLHALIEMDIAAREIERKCISKDFNIRVSVVDEWLAEYKREQQTASTNEIVSEVSPAERSVNGNQLLSDIRGELLKHIILPSGVAEPISAWVVLTYCYDAFRILPLLGIVSPVKRCGKTTLLEILQAMTNKALTASNVSSAAIFRMIEKYSPTLLVDEADTFLKDNDELRGVLNSGHTRASAFVIRVEGEEHEPVKFSTWGPKALSMIGTLPDTLNDRSVVVSLRRKAPGETVSRIDVDFEKECLGMRRACRRWADDNLKRLATMRPNIPTTNNDRVTDNWLPLLAIADVAGGDWPNRMREAMIGMFDSTDDSIGPKLLKDIRDIFQDRHADRIFSDDLVDALKEKKESPWSDWSRGRGLTPNGLARLLKPFEIHSRNMRKDENVKKGYGLSSFEEAFKCYIPSTPPAPTATTLQGNDTNDLGDKQSATNMNDVAVEKQRNLLKLNGCSVVAVEKGGTGEEEENTSKQEQKRLFEEGVL